jgi:hypothetical protein
MEAGIGGCKTYLGSERKIAEDGNYLINQRRTANGRPNHNIHPLLSVPMNLIEDGEQLTDRVKTS